MFESTTITLGELLEIENFDIGLQSYPIFDEDYRKKINSAIIMHYYDREIAFKHPNVFKRKLNARMVQIMEDKYNLLFKAKMEEFNIFNNVDITETFSHKIENNGKSSNTSESNSSSNANTETEDNINTSNTNKILNGIFPQDKIYKDTLESVEYANNGQSSKGNDNTIETSSTSNNIEDTTTSTNNGVNENTTIETYERKNVGSSAGLPFSRALIQYKEFIDNFDLYNKIIKDLADLFITVW